MTTDFRAALAEADEPAAPEVVGPEWQPCVKLPITVHVREQRLGEQHVSTREGITPVRPDDLIMRGVAGEEYPIGRELFQRTYRMGSSDEPAVPEGREPASVVGEPSDEELAQAAKAAIHDYKYPTELVYFLDSDSSEYEPFLLALRAAIAADRARWGHQPAPLPAGEVEPNAE